MDIKFYISTAGLAGDSHKLLVGEDSEGNKHDALFDSDSIIPFWTSLSLKLAKRKIIREFQICMPEKIEVPKPKKPKKLPDKSEDVRKLDL